MGLASAVCSGVAGGVLVGLGLTVVVVTAQQVQLQREANQLRPSKGPSNHRRVVG